MPTLKINKQTARKLRDIYTLIASAILLILMLLFFPALLIKALLAIIGFAYFFLSYKKINNNVP